MKYLEGLSKVQRECVENVEGPCMIIAGAGSGKTRVLTTRIAHLINNYDIDPRDIMALTFTKKAAEEMKTRIINMSGEVAESIWMGTFHSVFGKILRFEGNALGYDSSFTIYDTNDSHALIRKIIKEKNYNKEQYRFKSVFNRISNAKTNLVGATAYTTHSKYLEDDKKRGRVYISEIYTEYTKRCKDANAMDFDDLLYQTNVLFRDNPETLEKYQFRFKYIFVDEFQDTNISQYLILRKLCGKHNNICVVGDDAQSIYAFRGADINNILSFKNDFRNTKIIRLEQNYRSTKSILALANNIIGKNKNQIEKKLWTENEKGEEVKLIKTADDVQEAKKVVDTIFDDIHNKKIPPSDIAILYRTNRQSRVLEEKFKNVSIPYIIYGGISFYQRAEIKDMLAYLRFIVNPNDEEAFQRIINKPKRGVGDTSLSKIYSYKEKHNITLNDALNSIESFISGRIGQSIKTFNNLMKSIRNNQKTKNAYEIAKQVGAESGLIEMYFEDKSIEGVNKYENINELLSSIKSFVTNEYVNNDDKSLSVYLQDIALLTTVDQVDDNNQKKCIKLMTIHMSKGLEFKHVYLVGVENDLFPSMQASTPAEIEEERRLFYVAVTRAKRKIHISACLKRFINGKFKMCTPSIFLSELDDSVINKVNLFQIVKQKKPFNNNIRLKSNIWKENNRPIFKKQKAIKKYDIEPSDSSKIKQGMIVMHSSYGKGKVVLINKKAGHKAAEVEFDDKSLGKKTLLLSFAKLQIIE